MIPGRADLTGSTLKMQLFCTEEFSLNSLHCIEHSVCAYEKHDYNFVLWVGKSALICV